MVTVLGPNTTAASTIVSQINAIASTISGRIIGCTYGLALNCNANVFCMPVPLVVNFQNGVNVLCKTGLQRSICRKLTVSILKSCWISSSVSVLILICIFLLLPLFL